MPLTQAQLKDELPVVLNQDFKTFTQGQALIVKKWMAVGANLIVMCAVPGSDARPQGFQLPMLDAADGAAGEAAVDGAVAELFANCADLDNDVAVTFAGAYIENAGKDDLTLLTALIEQEGILAGQKWTHAQTVALFRGFTDTMGLEADAILVEAEEALEREAAEAEQEASAPKTEEKKPVGRPRKDGEPAGSATKPATDKKAAPAPKVATVDKSGWDATHMDALTLAGAMLPIYAQNPDGFGAALEKAVKMLEAANKVK